MKQYFWHAARILLAVFLIYSGIQHFVKPDFYVPYVPTFIPLVLWVVYLSGIVEIVLGAMLLLNKKYGKFGALGIFILMLVFFPIHIWDVFSSTPAIGSTVAAWIRLAVQVVFTAWAWGVYKNISKQ